MVEREKIGEKIIEVTVRNAFLYHINKDLDSL